MYSQTELLDLIESFGESLTPQSLRNYIKKGVCEGAADSKTGISDRGKTALYYRRTAFQAIIAKRLRLKTGIRYSMDEIALAYAFADKVMTDININLCDDESFLRVVVELVTAKNFAGSVKNDRTGTGDAIKNTLIYDCNGKLICRASDFKSLLGKWLLLMAGLQYYDLYGKCNGAELPVKTANTACILAKTNYTITATASDDGLNPVGEVIFQLGLPEIDCVQFLAEDCVIQYRGTSWFYK